MIVHKAIAGGGEGLEFVLSDATVDRYGDIVEPDGWDLRNFKKNPIALFGHSSGFPIGTWADLRVDGGKLIGRLQLAAKGTSARIDELIGLVEQGILRAVSVGFRPLDSDPIDPKQPWGAQRYKKQELLETSLVAVPANPAALALAKSMNISPETMSIAFGEHADTMRRDMSATGEQADTTSANQVRTRAVPRSQTKAPIMKTLSQRVEEARAAHDAARDAYNEHVGVDDYDLDQAKTFKQEMDSRKERLDSLIEAEKALGLTAQDASIGKSAPAINRRPLGSPQSEVKASDLIVRAAVCNLLAHLQNTSIDKVLEDRYPGHENTATVAKTAIAVATTTTSGWASQLVQTAMGEFLALLPPNTIYPVLRDLGVSLSFGPNSGNIKIPFSSSTTALAGGFVLEGDPIPVGRMTLDSITLTPTKFGIIVPMTKEVMRYTNPTLESVVRSELLARTAITLDGLLIDSTASSATRPAGLLNGVSALTASAGGDYQAFLEDIKTLLAPFDTANAGRSLALLMNPRQARNIRMLAGPNSSGFGWANQFLADFRVISSTVVTAGTVIAVDTADFVTSTGDAPQFETSDQATIHMESSPSPISATGTPNTVAAPVRSMFQTNSVALKMVMDVNWAMRRSGMVQYMTGVSW